MFAATAVNVSISPAAVVKLAAPASVIAALSVIMTAPSNCKVNVLPAATVNCVLIPVVPVISKYPPSVPTTTVAADAMSAPFAPVDIPVKDAPSIAGKVPVNLAASIPVAR